MSNMEFTNYQDGKWTSWNGDHYDYGIAADPDGEMAKTSGQLISIVLNKAAGQFKGKRECFVVLIQPSETDIGGDSPTSRATLERHFPEYSPRTMTDIVIAASAENNIPYIDLFPVYSSNPTKYYFQQNELGVDNHWNSEGIRVAARLVKAHLDAHNCIERH